ncbi:hypothetical protein PCASD_12410 [Puccinia coronata f. sp. avenae]|uniref:Uncharacterized protein n=1 Tax=Puccinia coronata f. sp. avenae TaxID=200324 RepID=A0A2N5U4R3_9BASI|nr:hypothetical protein PCASD_12410 [Puccinia coronata f. sp. avenae]
MNHNAGINRSNMAVIGQAGPTGGLASRLDRPVQSVLSDRWPASRELIGRGCPTSWQAHWSNPAAQSPVEHGESSIAQTTAFDRRGPKDYTFQCLFCTAAFKFPHGQSVLKDPASRLKNEFDKKSEEKKKKKKRVEKTKVTHRRNMSRARPF